MDYVLKKQQSDCHNTFLDWGRALQVLRVKSWSIANQHGDCLTPVFSFTNRPNNHICVGGLSSGSTTQSVSQSAVRVKGWFKAAGSYLSFVIKCALDVSKDCLHCSPGQAINCQILLTEKLISSPVMVVYSRAQTLLRSYFFSLLTTEPWFLAPLVLYLQTP